MRPRIVFSRAHCFSKGFCLTWRRGGWRVEMSGNEHLDHHSDIQLSDDSRRIEGRFRSHLCAVDGGANPKLAGREPKLTERNVQAVTLKKRPHSFRSFTRWIE
jgi:hypothetical protein